ncbi:hypothetical protein TRVL_07575 [Trypanosoma vivax]|nr:hypothetical protein TRVL_07575 [Trypanosoma vivax]
MPILTNEKQGPQSLPDPGELKTKWKRACAILSVLSPCGRHALSLLVRSGISISVLPSSFSSRFNHTVFRFSHVSLRTLVHSRERCPQTPTEPFYKLLTSLFPPCHFAFCVSYTLVTSCVSSCSWRHRAPVATHLALLTAARCCLPLRFCLCRLSAACVPTLAQYRAISFHTLTSCRCSSTFSCSAA